MQKYMVYEGDRKGFGALKSSRVKNHLNLKI